MNKKFSYLTGYQLLRVLHDVQSFSDRKEFDEYVTSLLSQIADEHPEKLISDICKTL